MKIRKINIKKGFRVLLVFLCFAFVFAAVSGCFPVWVNAEIESIAIEVYGFDKGAAEITVALRDCEEEGALSVSASAVWKEGTNSYKNFDVSWCFVGDDLGCNVVIIDPCCTNGVIAYVTLGEVTGKAVLRATGKSKNTVSSDVVIWIEEGEKTDDLYSLTQAYENAWLTEKNLEDIAYYYNNRSYGLEYPKNLDEETAQSVKQTYLEKFFPELLVDFEGYDYLEIENPIDGIRITAYYGTYNGCVVVSVWDDFVVYDYPQTSDVTIGGEVFRNFWIREIFVWKK